MDRRYMKLNLTTLDIQYDLLVTIPASFPMLIYSILYSIHFE